MPARLRLLLLAAVILAVLFFVGRPALFLGMVWLEDSKTPLPDPAAGKADFGGFNHSSPHDIVPIASDPNEAEAQLSALVARATREGLQISISGARHSMGGHTLYPGGIAVDMLPFNRMSLDAQNGILTVGAGARWADIIPFLEKQGFAVAVMQSNNDFSVGGSISVNCHGWQPDSPPISSTVESFHLVTAAGTILRCSRTENAELFSAVLGGYGLFGIILDVDLRVVRNELYRPELHETKPANYAQLYQQLAENNPDVGLAYGRISVAPDSFLSDAYIVLLKKQARALVLGGPLPGHERGLFDRLVFRGSVGSDYGKNLCWQLQTWFGRYASTALTRDQIMNEPSDWFANRTPGEADILHEYFVPPDRLNDFIEAIRPILLRDKPDLLNITIRKVKADPDTLLRYAPADRFGLVMCFHQKLDADADNQMEKLTREMITAALTCGGTYYLPYRPHATVEQFHAAYPQSATFFAAKQKYDPIGIFQNQFYSKYGGSPATPATSP